MLSHMQRKLSYCLHVKYIFVRHNSSPQLKCLYSAVVNNILQCHLLQCESNVSKAMQVCMLRRQRKHDGHCNMHMQCAHNKAAEFVRAATVVGNTQSSRESFSVQVTTTTAAAAASTCNIEAAAAAAASTCNIEAAAAAAHTYTLTSCTVFRR